MGTGTQMAMNALQLLKHHPPEKDLSVLSPVQELKEARTLLFARFSRGEDEGDFHESHTELVDQYFRRNLEESGTGQKLFRTKTPLAFVALGGYGRRELSVYSDIDVMILFESRIPPPARGLVEEAFYPIWDMGLELGHGIRSIKDCIRLARDDYGVLTSLLDARFICGDSGLYFTLMDSLQRKVLSKKAVSFSRWLAEQEQIRMSSYGDASYLLEPHLKEGIGGLRDYHHILWLSKAFFSLVALRDLEYMGMFSHREYEGLKESVRFIGLVRNRLHQMSARKNDRLTFDCQEKIAKTLGFKDDGDLLAVEQFLGRLHTCMTAVKSLHRSFVLTHLPSKGSRRDRIQPEVLADPLQVLQGEIGFGSATSILRDPHLLMEIFERSSRLNTPLSLESRRLVREFLYLVDRDFRGSERASRDFLSIIGAPYAFEALEQMSEVGFLGAFMPEFEHVRERVQFDSYHIYPVGTHLLHTLRHLKNLSKERNLLLPDIFSDLRSPQTLLLAGLLHDIGKVGKDHARRGAHIARNILHRLGLDRESAEDVLFLVLHHLFLAETATRRDLNDEKVVVQAARLIQSVDRLKMLYLLTWADSKATGPRAWSEWTENLVQELFFKVLHTLEKGELATPDASKRIHLTRQRVRRALTGRLGDQKLDALFEIMPPRYVLDTDAGEMARHLHVFRALREEIRRSPSSAFRLEATEEPACGSWELLFMAKDRPGLFADMAGVLALNNLNILSAHIYTWLDGTAVDIFKVSRPLDPLHTDALWEKVKRDLAGTFTGKLSLSQCLEEKSGHSRSRHPTQGTRPPDVRVDNASSDFFTLIEVFADDRVGLLYSITHTLFQLRLDIRIAKIATKADQIADVFYVLDLDGQKVLDPEQVEEIRKTLLRRLSQG
ncbi:MAG: [protein-PII] uridylyltransferase [Thermodesulfobacteriota bacterium]